VQECAAGAINATHDQLVKRDDMVILVGFVFDIIFKQGSPAAAQADDLMSFVDCAVYYGLDAWVESGDIASAG
jgi:hypothetical protein